MLKKILAVVLVFSFVFAFAACKKEETAAAPTELVQMADDATAGTRPGQANQEAKTEVATDVITNADGQTEVVTEIVTTPAEEVKIPETKEEVVAYFNAAANGVKADATKVIHKESAITLNGECQIPKAIDVAMKVLGGADKFIGDQLAKQSKGEQVYTGSDIDAKFPVEGEDYASKLTADDVKSVATQWSEDGKYLIVKIIVKSDAKSSDVKHGQGHAPKAFNVVLPGIVNDNVPGPVTSMLGGDAEISYPECYVIAYIDFDTGKVTKAQYVTNWTIHFGDDIVLPFKTKDTYEIYY